MEQTTYDRLERAGDIAAGAIGLVGSSAVDLIVAVLVRAKLGSPMVFRQDWPNKDGGIITLVEFSTMLNPDSERGQVFDIKRLTALGTLLRLTSLNELQRAGLELSGLPPVAEIFGGRVQLSDVRPADVMDTVGRRHVGSGLTRASAVQQGAHAAAQIIEARPLWRPLHLQAMFAGERAFVTGAPQHISGLTLPSGSVLRGKQVRRVLDVLAEALRG